MPRDSESECVLDTSALIDATTLDLGEYAESSVLITAITLGELAYGLGVGDSAEQEARARRFQVVVREYEILPFHVEEAKFYGALAALVRASGRNPRPRRLDLQIAATAGAARLPLLTCNPADFAGLDQLVVVVPVSRV